MANVDTNILLCEWTNLTKIVLKHSDSNKQFSDQILLAIYKVRFMVLNLNVVVFHKHLQ